MSAERKGSDVLSARAADHGRLALIEALGRVERQALGHIFRVHLDHAADPTHGLAQRLRLSVRSDKPAAGQPQPRRIGAGKGTGVGLNRGQGDAAAGLFAGFHRHMRRGGRVVRSAGHRHGWET